MGVLGALFGGAYLGVSGGSKAAPATPPINASSSDEADFIKCVNFPWRTIPSARWSPLTIEQEVLGGQLAGPEEGGGEALRHPTRNRQRWRRDESDRSRVVEASV